MHTIGLRSMLSIAALAARRVAALSASTRGRRATTRVRTYRVENVRTAKDRAAVARTGVAIVGSDHGALVVTRLARRTRAGCARLPFRVLRGSQPRLPARAQGLRARAAAFPAADANYHDYAGDGRRDGGDRRRQPRDREPHRDRHHATRAARSTR